MTKELEPCPFCGGEVERNNPLPGYFSGHGFHCRKCNAYFQLGDDDIEATEHYNTRYKLTCTNEYGSECTWLRCSECGAITKVTASRDMTDELMSKWCGNCGAEVVDG